MNFVTTGGAAVVKVPILALLMFIILFTLKWCHFAEVLFLSDTVKFAAYIRWVSAKHDGVKVSSFSSGFTTSLLSHDSSLFL